MYPTPELIDGGIAVWAIGFIDAKLTARQVDFGIHAANTRPGYCPDLPAFIQLCKPSPVELGMPSVEAAYREACQNAHPASRKDWSHKAVYHAATQVGMFELRSLDGAKTRPMFEDAYNRTVEAILHGEDIPEIPKAIADQTGKALTPEEKAADREVGQRALAGLKAMFD